MLEVYGDDALSYRSEGKAIVNGCTGGEKKSYCFANGCPRRVSEFRNFTFAQNFNNVNKKNKVPIASEGLNMDMILLIRHLIAQKKIEENCRTNEKTQNNA